MRDAFTLLKTELRISKSTPHALKRICTYINLPMHVNYPTFIYNTCSCFAVYLDCTSTISNINSTCLSYLENVDIDVCNETCRAQLQVAASVCTDLDSVSLIYVITCMLK